MAAFRGIHWVLVGMLATGCASTVGGHGTSAGSIATTSASPGPVATSAASSVSASSSTGFTVSPPTSSVPPAASLANALRVVQSHHYTPVDQTPPWYPQHTLNAIVGYPSDSADGHSQFVFFFVGNKYIGTDTGEPSTGVQYVSGANTTVTVKYFLYRSADPLCCPTGGTAAVRYQWNGHKLMPLDPIPPLTGAKHR